MTAVVAQPEGALAEIEELGYTVVKGVLDPASVAAFLEDTNRLARELPTVISTPPPSSRGSLGLARRR